MQSSASHRWVLQKWLQSMGVGTRRAVQAHIRAGRVTVDGEVQTRFAFELPPGARVCVDGVPLHAAAASTTVLMHKPKRHLTQLDDEGDRPGLRAYLPDDLPPLFNVGRLDWNSEGALLWTNDGILARRVLHPDVALSKVYHVKVRGHLKRSDPSFDRLRSGMTWRGVTYRAAQVSWLDARTRATWIEFVLFEGKNREIRNLCDACGWQVVKLRRVAIGPIHLLGLRPRCSRVLTQHEVARLQRAVQPSLACPSRQ